MVTCSRAEKCSSFNRMLPVSKVELVCHPGNNFTLRVSPYYPKFSNLLCSLKTQSEDLVIRDRTVSSMVSRQSVLSCLLSRFADFQQCFWVSFVDSYSSVNSL